MTCNNTKKKCQGHAGLLRSKYPYILPQFEQTVLGVLKRLCLKCGILVGDNRKCHICKEMAPVVKNLTTKGYTIDITYSGKVQGITV